MHNQLSRRTALRASWPRAPSTRRSSSMPTICPYSDIDLMKPNVEGLRYDLATNVAVSELWFS